LGRISIAQSLHPSFASPILSNLKPATPPVLMPIKRIVHDIPQSHATGKSQKIIAAAAPAGRSWPPLLATPLRATATETTTVAPRTHQQFFALS
jgi:hypothetical protein